MAMKKKYVLQGSREDFVAHLSERMREEADAATPDAKGTGKDKHGHDSAAKAIEWAIGEFEAWEETPGDDDDDDRPTSGPNGSERTTAGRRLAAAEAIE
jgi:hypothetical protein